MLIEVPDAVAVESINQGDLPENWQDFSAYHLCQQLGDTWLTAMKSAVLAVPSVIVPQEQNFLLNPQHPDFQRIKLLGTEDFVFDPRIKAA
jgi:RES domain-containing protein